MKKITVRHSNSQTTQLQALIHDLAGPLTALTMTLPEMQTALSRDRRISTHMYLELCTAATADLKQKLELLRTFADATQPNNDKIPHL